MERREFILAAGGALACAGMGPSLALAAGAAPGGFHQATFQAMLNQSLIAYDSARGVSLQLVEIQDGKSGPGLEQFTLLLAGSAASPLKDGSYEVYHASIGTVALYIEACGRQGQDALYRVQFSLLG
jgi:hypothetical protein